LNAEVTRATNKETDLQNQINTINGTLSGFTTGGVRAGVATTNSSGQITVSFSPAFGTSLIYFTVIAPSGTLLATGPQPPGGQVNATIISVASTSASGATVIVGQDTGSGPGGYLPYGAGVVIPWFAVGH